MITNQSSEFYSRQQRFVFVNPEADINPLTNLPFDKIDYVIVWVDDLVTCGVPIDDSDGRDMEFWAVLEPGEEL